MGRTLQSVSYPFLVRIANILEHPLLGRFALSALHVLSHSFHTRNLCSGPSISPMVRVRHAVEQNAF